MKKAYPRDFNTKIDFSTHLFQLKIRRKVCQRLWRRGRPSGRIVEERTERILNREDFKGDAIIYLKRYDQNKVISWMI